MVGSSCLPSLSQVWLLEKGALRRGLLAWGREGAWVGDRRLLLVGRQDLGRGRKSCWGGKGQVRNPDPAAAC